MSTTTTVTAATINFPLVATTRRDIGSTTLATSSITKKRIWDHTNMDKCPIFIQKPKKRKHNVLTPLDDSWVDKNGSGDGSVTRIIDKVESNLSTLANNKGKKGRGGRGVKLHHSNIAPSAFANLRIQQAYKRRMDNLEKNQNVHVESVRRLQDLYQQQQRLTTEQGSDNFNLSSREIVEDIVMQGDETNPLTEAEEWKLIRDWVEFEKAPYLKHLKTSDGFSMFKPPPMPNSLKGAQSCSTRTNGGSSGGHIDILVLKFFLGGIKNPLNFTLNCMSCNTNTYYVTSLRGLLPMPVTPAIPIKVYQPWSKIDSKNNWYFNSAAYYEGKFQTLTQRALPAVLKMEELYTNQINMGTTGSKTNETHLSLVTMSNRLSYFISFFFLSPFHLLVENGTVSPYPHFLLELNRRCTFKSTPTFDDDNNISGSYKPKCTNNNSNIEGCQLTYGVGSVRNLSHLFNYWHVGTQTSRSVQHHFSENFAVLENSLGLSSELNLLLRQYRTRQTSQPTNIMAGFTSRQERYLGITEFLHSFDKMDRSDYTEIVKWLHVPSIFHEHYTFNIHDDNYLSPEERKKKEEEETLTYERTAQLTCHNCKSRDGLCSPCNRQPVSPSQDKFLLKTVTKFVSLIRDRKTISTSTSSTPGIRELRHRSTSQVAKTTTTTTTTTTPPSTLQHQDSIETMYSKLKGVKDEESFTVLQPCYSDRVDTLLNVTRTLMTSYYVQFKTTKWPIFSEGHILCHNQLKGLGEALSLAFLRVAIMFSELITETEYDILMALAGVGGYQNSFNEYWNNLQYECANLRFQYKGLNNVTGYDKKDLMMSQIHVDYTPVYHLTDPSQGCDSSNLTNSIFIS